MRERRDDRRGPSHGFRLSARSNKFGWTGDRGFRRNPESQPDPDLERPRTPAQLASVCRSKLRKRQAPRHPAKLVRGGQSRVVAAPRLS
jgi:hypothetical protein